MRDYDPAANSFRSWAIGIAAMREIALRRGIIEPRENDPTEARWRAEGPVEMHRLDTVREVSAP